MLIIIVKGPDISVLEITDINTVVLTQRLSKKGYGQLTILSLVPNIYH